MGASTPTITHSTLTHTFTLNLYKYLIHHHAGLYLSQYAREAGQQSKLRSEYIDGATRADMSKVDRFLRRAARSQDGRDAFDVGREVGVSHHAHPRRARAWQKA
jgi:hypothetical protein